MKLIPLKQWYCDHCGKIILKAEDGYFEWKENTDGINYGFRIVHFKSCQYDDRTFSSNECIQDLQLDEFVEADGMVRLLEILERRQFRDKKEFLEMFHRLQVPYYEEARTYLEQAFREGYIDDIEDHGIKFSYNALSIITKYA
jgi:hypothetical protein